MTNQYKTSVGEVRPSQIMFTYGVGSIVDLPKLSVIVMGLEDWPQQQQYYKPIMEDRLLRVVRAMHPEVQQLLAPPYVSTANASADPFDNTMRVGVPVASFPRWMVCPRCKLLAPVNSGLFELDENPYHPERTVFRHITCTKKGRSKKWPEAVPARFLVTCPSGHLDDFPWVDYVHRGNPCAEGNPLLRLLEFGPGGEARDLYVKCDTCGEGRHLTDAFRTGSNSVMPLCTGRRPHLRDYDPENCEHQAQTILLGASNLWFPVVLSTIALPVDVDPIAQYLEDNWNNLQVVEDVGGIELLQKIGQLEAFPNGTTAKEIWEAVAERNSQDGDPPEELSDIKIPEWNVFTDADPALNSPDFELRRIHITKDGVFGKFEQIVLVERLREVQAMVGFTRLDAVGELTDPQQATGIPAASIARQPTTWVPASEVRGEGIFLQFNEDAVHTWERTPEVIARADYFRQAWNNWCDTRGITDSARDFPGMRYVLLHSFSHALMRQLALESGYSAASLKERLYCRTPEQDDGPMAGVLIYTAASDSEGTLGGLVHLGEPDTIKQHIRQALLTATLCTSDPVCAERNPNQQALHGAACHACLFAPETACERGNKFLDRSLLVATVEHDTMAFFNLD